MLLFTFFFYKKNRDTPLSKAAPQHSHARFWKFDIFFKKKFPFFPKTNLTHLFRKLWTMSPFLLLVCPRRLRRLLRVCVCVCACVCVCVRAPPSFSSSFARGVCGASYTRISLCIFRYISILTCACVCVCVCVSVCVCVCEYAPLFSSLSLLCVCAPPIYACM